MCFQRTKFFTSLLIYWRALLLCVPQSTEHCVMHKQAKQNTKIQNKNTQQQKEKINIVYNIQYSTQNEYPK